MQQRKTFVIVVVGLASLLALACIMSVASADQQVGSLDKFSQCQIDCNEAYGGFNIWPSSQAPQGHADCVLKCERRLWRDIDKETK
jgi:hypothetical protein